MPTCSNCKDTGVEDTGNNALPCSCPAGKTALFNVAGIEEPVTGAELSRHLLNFSPEPLSREEVNERKRIEKGEK